MAKIKKIVVDRNLCIGVTACVLAAGSVYEIDAEQKAVIKQKGGVKNSGPVDREALEDAGVTDDVLLASAQACPVRAIILTDEEGKQVYP